MNKREKKNKKRAEKYVKTNFKIAKSILGGFRKGGKLKPAGEKKQDLPAKPTPGAMYSKGGGVTAPPPATPTSPAPVGSKVKVGSEKEDKIRKKKYARDGGEVKKKKRYGGSVSYSSSQVRGYSKTYAGMGGEDE
tara:strand:+ start:1151 stop:1555 length:405 start_codon:yes stop_codon:yes gene_type:complete